MLSRDFFTFALRSNLFSSFPRLPKCSSPSRGGREVFLSSGTLLSLPVLFTVFFLTRSRYHGHTIRSERALGNQPYGFKRYVNSPFLDAIPANPLPSDNTPLHDRSVQLLKDQRELLLKPSILKNRRCAA